MANLSGQELQQLGAEMFGSSWRKTLAEHIGLSYARVSQLSNVDKLPTKSTIKILSLYEQWKRDGKITPGMVQQSLVVKDEEDDLTDAQILERINKRFAVMNKMVDGMIKGVIRSMIVSGAPGIGKTFDLEKALRKAHKDQGLYYHILRGTCSAPGLYQTLYHARKGGVVVIDDGDSVFNDEQSFDILKSGLDSTNTRVISWRKQSSWIYDVNSKKNADDGEVEDLSDRFPNEFEFNGAMVFITNQDFREMAERGLKASAHFQALLSRSMYLTLTLKTIRSRVIRIRDVFMNSMRKDENLSVDQAKVILDYVLANKDRLHELSLRTVKHICQLYHLGDDWEEIVEYTKMATA
ncbi:hypothetical protein E4H12_05345, partial [Candidatus Thorarchaeota archaeon]